MEHMASPASAAPHLTRKRKKRAETVIDPLTNEEVPATVVYSNTDETLQCTICKNTMVSTLAVIPCIHRFCSDCLNEALRKMNTETSKTRGCPLCRTKLTSRRSSKLDSTFDALIEILVDENDESRRGRALQNSDVLDAANFCQQRMAALRRNRGNVRGGSGAGFGGSSGSSDDGEGGMDSNDGTGQRKISDLVASRRDVTFKVIQHPSETRLLPDVSASCRALRMCDERGHYASAMHVKKFITQCVLAEKEPAIPAEALELFASSPSGDTMFALDGDMLLIELLPLFDDSVNFIVLTFRVKHDACT